jgi:drug/metabolite transporter (DMT)-like permease
MLDAAKTSSVREQSRQRLLIGVAAALGAIMIWAGWIVATRYAAQTLDISIVALLRYGIPALALAPIWLRTGLVPQNVPPRAFVALIVGAGTPFFLAAAFGMRFAPAAEVGPLLPGTMPLFAALLVGLFFREKISLVRKAGYALIAASVLVIVVPQMLSEPTPGAGHTLILVSAFLWAIYTVALQRSGLSAFEATAVISVWSAISLLPFGIMPLFEAVQQGHAAEIAIQALTQGVLSGIVATILFAIAILRLGSSHATALAALLPVLAAILAIPVLGEIPHGLALIGIILASFGVAFASGTFDRAAAPLFVR